MHPKIPTRIEPCVVPIDKAPAAVGREFAGLVTDGAQFVVAGRAKKNPRILLRRGYAPKFRVDLFDTSFFLTGLRQNPDLRFFVAYVVQRTVPGARPRIYPRIFYKDVSLIWRSASHVVFQPDELWIGKGEVRATVVHGEEMFASAEETTDLPVEMQFALNTLSRALRRVPFDVDILPMILREAPASRIEPYADFTRPREIAASNPRNLINGGRRIAYFSRRNDPTSLKFARGFEPDFRTGVRETSAGSSKLYGGTVRQFRVLSVNQKIQYLFLSGPRHVWIVPPQATTTELSSYGLRTIDVLVDEDLCVPGYEYHYYEESEDDDSLVSQIPEGFVGEPSDIDDSRSDASLWLDAMPVVREFRRTVLRRGHR